MLGVAADDPLVRDLAVLVDFVHEDPAGFRVARDARGLGQIAAELDRSALGSESKAEKVQSLHPGCDLLVPRGHDRGLDVVLFEDRVFAVEAREPPWSLHGSRPRSGCRASF